MNDFDVVSKWEVSTWENERVLRHMTLSSNTRTLYEFLCNMPYRTLLDWKGGVPLYFKYANNREFLDGLTKRDFERKVLEVSISFFPNQSVTLYLGEPEE